MKVSVLIDMVNGYLEEVSENKRKNIEARKKKGLYPDAVLYVPSMNGDTAWTLGEAYGRENASWNSLCLVCEAFDIDIGVLIACVKSMNRWEKHGGAYDRDIVLEWHIPEGFLEYISL